MDQKPNECNRIRYQECFTVLCVVHWQWSSTLLVLLLLDRSSSAIEGPCCSGRCSRTHQTTHEISPNTMQYHWLPYNTIWYHAIPSITIQYHALPCNPQYHIISSITIQYQAISCNPQYQIIQYKGLGEDASKPHMRSHPSLRSFHHGHQDPYHHLHHHHLQPLHHYHLNITIFTITIMVSMTQSQML